jgi:hypothetical protein
MRVHNEWFRRLSKTKCDCGCKNTEVWSWGEYRYGKWRTIQHFCRACFPAIQEELLKHAEGCGCEFDFISKSGRLPEWLAMPVVCELEKAA